MTSGTTYSWYDRNWYTHVGFDNTGAPISDTPVLNQRLVFIAESQKDDLLQKYASKCPELQYELASLHAIHAAAAQRKIVAKQRQVLDFDYLSSDIWHMLFSSSRGRRRRGRAEYEEFEDVEDGIEQDLTTIEKGVEDHPNKRTRRNACVTLRKIGKTFCLTEDSMGEDLRESDLPDKVPYIMLDVLQTMDPGERLELMGYNEKGEGTFMQKLVELEQMSKGLGIMSEFKMCTYFLKLSEDIEREKAKAKQEKVKKEQGAAIVPAAVSTHTEAHSITAQPIATTSRRIAGVKVEQDEQTNPQLSLITSTDVQVNTPLPPMDTEEERKEKAWTNEAGEIIYSYAEWQANFDKLNEQARSKAKAKSSCMSELEPLVDPMARIEQNVASIRSLYRGVFVKLEEHDEKDLKNKAWTNEAGESVYTYAEWRSNLDRLKEQARVAKTRREELFSGPERPTKRAKVAQSKQDIAVVDLTADQENVAWEGRNHMRVNLFSGLPAAVPQGTPPPSLRHRTKAPPGLANTLARAKQNMASIISSYRGTYGEFSIKGVEERRKTGEI